MLAKALGIEPAGRAPAPKPEPYDPMEEFLDATAVTN